MTKKAIVVGSGFVGIASSVRLKALGYDVVLLEKLEEQERRITEKNISLLNETKMLEQQRNKMALIRELARQGIRNFDVDSFYSSVRSIARSTAQ